MSPQIHLPLYVEFVEAGHHPQFQWHDHDVSEIAVILSGHGTHHIEVENRSRHVEIRRGDVLVLHPHIMHAYSDTEDLAMVNVVFDSQKLPLPILDGYSFRYFKQFFPLNSPADPYAFLKPILHLDDGALIKVRSIIDEIQQKTVSFAPGILFETLCTFMQLLVALNKTDEATVSKAENHQANFQMGKAIYTISNEYADKLTLEYLAKSVNMSVRNFCRQFKLTTGYSPIQYLLQQRMAHAIELLLETNRAIESIAEECGFSNENYFRKMFLKMYKVSPGKYRKSHKDSPDD